MHSTGGLRSISKMGGLGPRMPLTAVCFFVAALALGGMPPLNGFMSKFTLLLAAGERHLLWAAVIAAVTGLLTLACLVLAGVHMFWGTPRSPEAAGESPGPEHGPQEVPATMYVSMLVLAVLCVVLGVFPRVIHPLLDHATQCILRIAAGAG
jgi:formate hydrogenlyase subunit 3/multisubunit Na+/H+ antiporter MnhD subunit